jgi:hypothetical protein
METFCLFSFKGVISIHIFGWANTNLFIMEATKRSLLILSPWPQPPQILQRDDPLGRSPLTNINVSFSYQFGFLFKVSMLKAT